MDNVLIKQLKDVLPKGMTIPKEIEMLYEYIEENNLYTDINGIRHGNLYPEEKMKASRKDEGREGGTNITFYAEDPERLKYCFDNYTSEVNERLCVFAQSGGDDSSCALWLDDDGKTKIVHMGSGSGSMLWCVLTDNGVDFLRLLAIGYDEICWNEDFPYPPNENPDNDFIVKPNLQFRNWVENTFNVAIPKTALEIIKCPAELIDEDSEDEFLKWSNKFIDD